jgi:hypothetical protein
MCPTDSEIASGVALDKVIGPVADPGYEQRESIKQRADALMAEAEKLLGDAGIERADPAKLKVDREVAQAIDMRTGEVLVSGAQPGRHYVWVFRDPTGEFAGRFVLKMKALGWQLVQHDMPEAREHTHVDGTRVVADCLLMWCPNELYKKFEEMDRIRRQRQSDGCAVNLYDLARQAGVEVRTLDDLGDVGARLRSTAEEATYERRKLKINNQLRKGTIPGIPSPGRPG